MAIINVYRNLDLDEREIIDAESGKELYKTVDKIDWKNSIIIANGNNVDKDYIIQDDDVISIKQYPSALTASTIAGIIVTSIAVGVILYGVGTIVVDAIKDSIKDDLMDSLKDMNKSMSNSAVTQLPSIRGANNQVGSGKVVPFVLGRSLFTPYLCGSYNSIGGEDGLDQYMTLLLNVGYNDISVKDVKIGDFRVASNKEGISDGFLKIDGSYRFTDGGENATQIELISENRQSVLFPQKVAQSSFNVPIIHTPEDSATGLKENVLILDKFSALNPQKIEVEIDFRSLIAYNDEGNETTASAKVGLAISYDDGNHWEGFGQIDGSEKLETITDEKTLAKFDMKEGDTLSVSTFTEQRKRTLRYCGTYNVDFNKIKNSNSDKYIIVRIVRFDTDTTDTRVQNAPILSSLRTWCFDWNKSVDDFVPLTPFSDKLNGKVQRMAIKIKATQNVKDVLSQINCIVEPKTSIYQNGAWTAEKYATSNPASTVYNLMTHKMLGSHVYNAEDVDFNKLGELYEFCEEKNISVNGVLVNQSKLQDVINKVLALGRSALILENNKYSFWIDKPQTIPVTVLNNHNLLPEITNAKTFEQLPQAYKVKFIDEQNLWQEGEFYLPVEDNVDLENPHTVIETIELTWCTNYEQAVKYVYYYHATRKLRPETWTRKQGVEGAVPNIGDLVLLQDDTISVGIGDGGEITDIEVGAGNVIGFTTDSYFNIPSDVTQEYAVTLNSASGTRTDKVIFDDYYTNHFYFKTPISYNDLIQYAIGDIVSFGVYEKVTTKALVMGKKQNEDLNYDITLVPYSDGVYTADSGVIPEYNPQTTTASPIVDVPTLPVDLDKIQSDKGSNGNDGLTVFVEKSALVFSAENDGTVQEQNLHSKVVIQQKGFDVPFTIGHINSPKGLEVTSDGHTVNIKVLEGKEMDLNGTIEIPISYNEIINADYFKNEQGIIYTDENGKSYISMTTDSENKSFSLYISYAKSIKGNQGVKGEDGRAVGTINNYYSKNNRESGVTWNNVTWEENPTLIPLPDKDNKYVWGYEKTLDTNGNLIKQTEPKRILNFAQDGMNGEEGRGVDSIIDEYALNNNSITAPADEDFTPNTLIPDSDNRFLWNREKITYSKGEPLHRYTEKRIIGMYGEKGDIGADGLTILIEKPALVFSANSSGKVNETYIESDVVIQQKGVDVPFKIDTIESPAGFSIDRYYHTIKITALEGTSMLDEGVIKIPITYYPFTLIDNYVNSNGVDYTNKSGKVYQRIQGGKESKTMLYISYAKAKEGLEGVEGQRAIKYWGITETAPTLSDGVVIGDYYLRPSDVRILQVESITNSTVNWKILSPKTEPDLELYRLQINDVTSILANVDKKDDVVSAVNGYFDLLLTNTAFINKLFAKNISILENGYIQSENYMQGSQGFKISADGNVELNKATIRGSIESNNFTDEIYDHREGEKVFYKTVKSGEGYKVHANTGVSEMNQLICSEDCYIPCLEFEQRRINMSVYGRIGIPLDISYGSDLQSRLDTLLEQSNAFQPFATDPTSKMLYCFISSRDLNSDKVTKTSSIGNAILKVTNNNVVEYYIVGNTKPNFYDSDSMRLVVSNGQIITDSSLASYVGLRYQADAVSVNARKTKTTALYTSLGRRYKTMFKYFGSGGRSYTEDTFYNGFCALTLNDGRDGFNRDVMEGVVVTDNNEYIPCYAKYTDNNTFTIITYDGYKTVITKGVNNRFRVKNQLVSDFLI